ncbi:flagellar basal body rod protein FlgB [Nocardioides sp. Kera G14]|uniref:flagellar basal body rod protein FlgB n=1 Tax=Nocardioides sp. Kera G14 TaxID=2884264 RepID=UPI001D1142E3|nr:flagellar basal body rod protein FlgB [Nocardioides sp. Kera G14]UDY24073.1 flagellar basal body rod protein FlgB [Nocardioides sp. Kera G14]
MSFGVSSDVTLTLHTALNGLTQRQDVISDDIANVDTPNFRAQSVDFESSLQQAISDGEFDGSDSVVTTSTDTQTPVGANGNNVDLRKETMAMIQTQYSYQMVGRALSDQYSLLKTAAAGGA